MIEYGLPQCLPGKILDKDALVMNPQNTIEISTLSQKGKYYEDSSLDDYRDAF